MNQALGVVAQYLADLKDSHTKFWPPGHVAQVDYGFELLIVGDSVFVNRMKKGSDAEAKGLKRGDLVLAFDKIRSTRQTLHIIEYVYFTLSPRPGVTLTVVSPGDSQPHKVAFNASIKEGQRVIDYTDQSQLSRLITEMEDNSRAATNFYRSLGDSVLIWRMPMFAYADDAAINEMIARAQTYRNVILDLRDNPGGYIATLQYLTGQFFDHDVTMYTARERKKSEPVIAKAAKKPYLGMLIILINANSASSAEMFSRTMQLQGRGILVGDRSAGMVITSVSVPHLVGFDRVLEYGASMSIADVVMADGQRLENVGVMPDHRVLPTGADLAAGRDVQMMKALELVGVKVTPEQATLIARGAPKGEKP
jgi:C-terminal processing protease CtpA/Prc